MMEVDREQLQFLANQPLGSPELQNECDRIAHARGSIPASGELKETAKRIAKKWLPLGKSPSRARKCNVETAEQVDIEDAIEAAGGLKRAA
jgi:hypothetical protein